MQNLKTFTVQKLDIKLAQSFVIENHYAKGAANTAIYIHGMFLKTKLYGLVWWMIPGSPNVARWTARQFTGSVNWKNEVLTLSRMVILDSAPKNSASWLLSRSMSLIRRDKNYRVAVTYADRRQNHTGHVYKAAGWVYTGESSKEAGWVDSKGRQIARKAKKNRTKQEMYNLGYERLKPTTKARYIKAITRVKLHPRWLK